MALAACAFDGITSWLVVEGVCPLWDVRSCQAISVLRNLSSWARTVVCEKSCMAVLEQTPEDGDSHPESVTTVDSTPIVPMDWVGRCP